MAIIATNAFASLCVWRKPDQDIKQFFPGADTYKTEIKNPGSKRAAIEKRLGRNWMRTNRSSNSTASLTAARPSARS